MKTNLHHLLAEQAQANPSRPALTYKDTTCSYQDLWGQVVGAAAGLADLGLARGERVAVFLDKRIETVVAIFAVSAAGGTLVPINPVLRPHQVGHILDDAGVSILLTSAPRRRDLADELTRCGALRTVILVDDGADSSLPPSPPDHVAERWSDCLQPDTPVLPSTAGVDLDMAAIFYTSGSTGRPKGVVLSHRNLLVGAESVSTYLENTADDVLLAALPLSFDAGFSQLTTAFHVGAHVVLMNYLLPGDVVRLCGRHSVTGLTCVPPLWNQIAALEWPPEATSSLRYVANTGGHLPKSTLDKLRLQLPDARPFLMYGLTEAFRSTYLDPGEIDRRPGSMGKAIPNAEILVVRPDGTRCDPGEPGELVHRGPLVAMGYWNDPERTAERFKPVPGRTCDWRPAEIAVWSGDQVMADDDGFLYFVGRNDDMIKTSGYRVSPTEIEEVAYDTGCVADAAAFGLPDEDLGQRIVLVVSPSAAGDLDPEELLAVFRRDLPSYMVPSIEVRDQLPHSPNGKLDRAAIRAELAA